jgi:hypothetical protein
MNDGFISITIVNPYSVLECITRLRELSMTPFVSISQMRMLHPHDFIRHKEVQTTRFPHFTGILLLFSATFQISDIYRIIECIIEWRIAQS